MKKCVKQLLIASAILWYAAGQASAAPDRTRAASDPDGDGWGWENSQSCKVVSTEAMSAAPDCLNAASDPDGDGWGRGKRSFAPLLMQWAQQFGVGYVAWSTAGNDTANAWLDLMSNWSDTTSWGNMVWYSQYGISNAARKASVY